MEPTDWPLVVALLFVAIAILWSGDHIAKAVASLKVGASPEEIEAITQRVMGTSERLTSVRTNVDEATATTRGIEPESPRTRGER